MILISYEDIIVFTCYLFADRCVFSTLGGFLKVFVLARFDARLLVLRACFSIGCIAFLIGIFMSIVIIVFCWELCYVLVKFYAIFEAGWLCFVIYFIDHGTAISMFVSISIYYNYYFFIVITFPLFF